MAEFALPDNRLRQRPSALIDGLASGWAEVCREFFASPAGRALDDRVQAALDAGVEVYPADPWRALRELAPGKVRVVVLGQDPYHGPGEAHGLAFSVPAGVPIPPSLRNIRQELAADLGFSLPPQGDLMPWVRAGVLLLNTALTVERDRAGSHARWGWALLTDALIAQVARDPVPKVFVLWGAHAQAKRDLIASAGTGHAIVASNHPSPLSARRPPVPFVGSRPFSRVNALLREGGSDVVVDWRLE